MPYVSDSNLDENEQNATAPANQPGQMSGQPNAVSGSTGGQSLTNSATEAPQAPTLASGGGLTTSAPGQGKSGAGSASGSSGSSSSFNPTAPTSSGNWTNLQNYLSANNGGAFGQQFAGNVGNDLNQAQGAITNAASNFQNEVNQGTVQNNQDVLNEVSTAPQAMSTADQQAFENQLNDSYTGPQSAGNDSGFSTADTQAHNAYTEAQAAQTPGGEQALLEKFYSAPQYTAGQQSLDEAILSMDPNAQAALGQLASQAGTLPVNYENAFNSANAEAGQAASESAQAQQAAEGELFGNGGSAANVQGGAIGNLQNTLTSQAATAKAAYDQEQNDIQAAVASGDFSKLTPAEASALGYSNPEPYSYGITPAEIASQYLTLNPDTGITSDTEATAQQAAQMDALARLAGLSTDPYLNSQMIGTAPTNPVTFNESGYSSAVEGAKEAFNNSAAPIQTQIAQDEAAAQPSSASQSEGFVTPQQSQAEQAAYNATVQLNNLRAQYGLPPLALPAVSSASGTSGNF